MSLCPGCSDSKAAPVAPHKNPWTTGEKWGAALLVMTLALVILATLFGTHVFHTMRIGQAHLISASLGIASLFFLLPGAILFCHLCKKEEVVSL